VVQSIDVVPEIIVVDDHSTDESVTIVRDFMATHDYFPIFLLCYRYNRGLPRARNAGFAAARADSVFVLDADNLIYPRALHRLRTALKQCDAQFAYGVIAKFGDRDELLSSYPWDVQRLLKDNYIDAMALLRRSAWQAVGGYPTSDAIYGWEDYALWLSFAERGYRGAFVHQVVARYRQHGPSMLEVSNLDSGAVRQYLRTRYRSLPWETRA
jgi:glycosyltransferase involved in cell wall biosynthesis